MIILVIFSWKDHSANLFLSYASKTSCNAVCFQTIKNELNFPIPILDVGLNIKLIHDDPLHLPSDSKLYRNFQMLCNIVFFVLKISKLVIISIWWRPPKRVILVYIWNRHKSQSNDYYCIYLHLFGDKRDAV